MWTLSHDLSLTHLPSTDMHAFYELHPNFHVKEFDDKSLDIHQRYKEAAKFFAFHFGRKLKKLNTSTPKTATYKYD